MNEQMYTTDTAVERLTRSVAEAVESGGRFTRAEFSVDDVATILGELQAMTADRDRWVKLWEKASNSVIGLRADIESAVQQPNREALARVVKPHAFDGPFEGGKWLDPDAQTESQMEAFAIADAVLAALAVPATGEVEPVYELFPGTREALDALTIRGGDPVSRDEARAELIEIQVREGLSNGWRKRIADAIMAAGSRRPEAAPSDTDREALMLLIDPNALEPDAYPFPGDAAERVLAAGFSRSQPVQVEVTDADHARDTKAWIDKTLSLPMYQNAISEYGQGVVETLRQVRKLLDGGMHPDTRAALGGGDHAE